MWVYYADRTAQKSRDLRVKPRDWRLLMIGPSSFVSDWLIAFAFRSTTSVLEGWVFREMLSFVEVGSGRRHVHTNFDPESSSFTLIIRLRFEFLTTVALPDSSAGLTLKSDDLLGDYLPESDEAVDAESSTKRTLRTFAATLLPFLSTKCLVEKILVSICLIVYTLSPAPRRF